MNANNEVGAPTVAIAIFVAVTYPLVIGPLVWWAWGWIKEHFE